MAPGADHRDSGRAVAGRHTSAHCTGGPLTDGTSWAREGTGQTDIATWGLQWTGNVLCEQENGRRLDPEGRAPVWGGRSPSPWTAGVAVAETWLAWENATDGPATRGRAQTRPRCLESQSLVSC